MNSNYRLVFKRSWKALRNDFLIRCLCFVAVAVLYIAFSAVRFEIFNFVMVWKVYLFFFILSTSLSLLALLMTLIMDSQELERESVILAESDGVIKLVMDCILGRHHLFKNSPRNVTVLRSLYVSSNFFLLGTLVGVIFLSLMSLLLKTSHLSVDSLDSYLSRSINIENILYALLFFNSLLVGIYLKIQHDYQTRWMYCADKYYSIRAIEANCQLSEPKRTLNKKDELYKDLDGQKVSLAIDILHFDLWAKRGFELFFLDTAVLCAKRNNQKKLANLIEKSRKSIDLPKEKDVEKMLKNSFL